ncbi:UNVERIFIED_CONTAM: hypothetical protein Sradi_3196600 [Sesamum radiatum]|uniref:Uncharacterized protein n=1 Tax=Sesamum radiatum TaxID=300843 RepID=A0AAW2RHF3_SESRA
MDGDGGRRRDGNHGCGDQRGGGDTGVRPFQRAAATGEGFRDREWAPTKVLGGVALEAW